MTIMGVSLVGSSLSEKQKETMANRVDGLQSIWLHE